MSRPLTECVKAPTEMKSTPHSAYWRIVSNVIPPLDSVSYLPAIISTAVRVSSTKEMLDNFFFLPSVPAAEKGRGEM